MSAAQKDLLGPGKRQYLESKISAQQAFPCYVKGEISEIEQFVSERSGTIRPVANGFIRITVRPADLLALAGEPYVSQVDFSWSRGYALNDSFRVINNVEPIFYGDSGLIQPFTGKDVLIGVIDGGIDYNHPDFQFADGRTRILKYWKQHESFSTIYTPTLYGYGREYDSSLINAGSVPLSAQYIDHGCTVTGTAAGNANANGRHRGMAPESDLIIVSSDFNILNWKASIADAVDYIIRVADSLDQPVVINASLGDYIGSHDGLDPSALFIDSLLLDQPGRLLVAAAGNSGGQPAYHLGYDVTADTTFTWFVSNPSLAIGTGGVFLEIWADTADIQNVEFSISADKTTGNYSRRGITGFHNLTGNLNTIVHDTIWNNGNIQATAQFYMEPRNGQYLMQVLLDSPDSSQYSFGLLATGNGHFDLWSAQWLGLNDMVQTLPTSVQFPQIVDYRLPDTLMSIVDSWNCSPHVVSVANYYSRLSYLAYNNTIQTVAGTKDELSISSSKGPTRTHYLKPDIGATGDMALSAGSINLLNAAQSSNPQILDVGGMHVRNGGTSMASPVVAGIGALYLEKCPNSGTADFLNAIHTTARSDAFTGILPNYGFGYGKVNGLAVLQTTDFVPTISGVTEFCEDESTVLTTSLHDSYIWSDGSTGMTALFDSTQAVYVDAWNAKGCKGVSDTVQLTEYPNPPVPVITQIGNSLTSSPAFQYQWVLNGSALIGEDNQQYIAQTSGYYQVIAINQYGCFTYSDSIYISIVGVSENPVSGMSVYPNPVKNSVVVDLGSKQSYSYTLLDVTGKILSRGRSVSGQPIDMSALGTGIYFVRVENSGIIHTHRLVKL